MQQIADGVFYVGVNDHQLDLFEGQYIVPNGMAYNSYAIIDEKIAVMDGVDGNFTDEWLGNLDEALAGRTPDYLIVQHMEPDHSGSIQAFAERYPEATIVGSMGAFNMMLNYFGTKVEGRNMVVKEGSTLSPEPSVISSTFTLLTVTVQGCGAQPRLNCSTRSASLSAVKS